MSTNTWVGIAAGSVIVLGGGAIAWDKGLLSGIGLPGPGGAGTIHGGIPVTVGPNVTSPKDGSVGGPSPGPSGKYTYPALWAVAPQTLPVAGYHGGPAITRPHGNVWLVIAVNLKVSGTVNGQNAANLGPWVGIAEYANGTRVRVYPQRAAFHNGQLSTLGAWSGGGKSS